MQEEDELSYASNIISGEEPGRDLINKLDSFMDSFPRNPKLESRLPSYLSGSGMQGISELNATKDSASGSRPKELFKAINCTI